MVLMSSFQLSEFLCWNCDKPGHNWQNCEEPFRPNLVQKEKGGATMMAKTEEEGEGAVGGTSKKGMNRDKVAAMVADMLAGEKRGANFLRLGTPRSCG